MKDHHPCLTGFPHIISLPLQWGDHDAFGHVNNTVYIRWAEPAPVENSGVPQGASTVAV